MAGISSQALGKLDNKRGFNGNELQEKEFSDGNGIDWYDFNARTYDQQIGRFMQIDPLTDDGGQESLSPYHFSYNNSVRYDDPDGKCPTCILGGIIGAAVDYGTQVAGNLIEGKSITESLTDVDGGSILASAVLGAVTSGASVVMGTTKTVVTIGVKANQLSKAQKAVISAGNSIKKAIDKANANQNPGSGRGKNNRKPDLEAKGDYIVTDKKGNTTYKENSQNPSGFDEVKRTDVEGKAHTNTDGSKVPTPHMHEKGKKDVRPAKKGEDY